MVTKECEMFLLVDANGDYVASDTEAGLLGQYDEDVGRDDDTPVPYRIVRVVVTVPLPVVPTLTGTVPADGDAVLQVA